MSSPDAGPSYTDAPADVADVSGEDTSVTSGHGPDVGARSIMPGDPSRADGVAVADLDDVDQVAALLPGPGMSFRGSGADCEVGQSYEVPGWLRTSRDPRVASDNFAGRAVVALFGATGRDLAPLTDHPEEQETVFLPGSTFTVLRRGDVDGLDLTVVRVHADDADAHVDDSDAVEDAVTRAVAAIVRARMLPPETVARPERFSGAFGTRR